MATESLYAYTRVINADSKKKKRLDHCGEICGNEQLWCPPSRSVDRRKKRDHVRYAASSSYSDRIHAERTGP